MARKATTLNLDEALLQAAERVAASRNQKAQDVVESALRVYLDFEILEQVWNRNTLTEDEAMRLAYEELHASRS